MFGDSDCDGAETPALYRATAGEVMYVNSFAAHVGDTAYAERITAGSTGREGSGGSGTHGCDIVRISPTRLERHQRTHRFDLGGVGPHL